MKIVDRSVDISKSLFPQTYDQRSKYRTYHFAFGWLKNELLAIGQNRPDAPSGKAFKFAKRFNTQQIIKYPYLHAEVDLISRLWGRFYINNKLKVVVVRINRFGELMNSKPCKSCSAVLSALNIERVWWSDRNGSIVTGELK